ncbi:hypothetical protein [Aquabacterium sp. OR-4]|uniref:hypothetical protein n=1 Tax=Aquabacterium sp. OR-4 TaxID=2978127 RepID=UPI0021B27071|nr:hypothetical protein [Aquabacterium sp. OR-4]MDT7837787.1 hypothetical protein [Aquabacterium sp. OR-4]
MFQSTQPLPPASDPRGLRPAGPASHAGDALDSGATHLNSLSPSLLQDLMRFEKRDGDRRELLEVLAAGVRHTQPLAIRLEAPGQELTLSIYPSDGMVHCQQPVAEFLASDLARVQVLHVQPALSRPPRDATLLARMGDSLGYAPLAPVLWAVALTGARAALLPELAGQAAYRVSPGVNLGGLTMPTVLSSCVARLRRQTHNLREIADWPGISREGAMRLLNALYLQSALIVSRSHPAATNEGWEGYGPR